MVKPDQEAIDTFMSITGLPEAAAILKLEEYSGNLNEAVNAHFTDGDRIINQEASFPAPQDDDMDIDDPIPIDLRRPTSSLSQFARLPNPFSLLDPNFTRSIFDSVPDISSLAPLVSHPREVNEIPIEVKDGPGASGQSASAPRIEDVTETTHGHGPEIRGTVVTDDDDDDVDNGDNNTPNALIARTGPSAPIIVDLPDDIEEEMIQAAIEASKQDAAMSNQRHDDHIDLRDPTSRPRQSHVEDAKLSLQTERPEKASKELRGEIKTTEPENMKPAASEELRGLLPVNGRQSHLEAGSSSIQDDAEDDEELPLVRHRRRRVSSAPINRREDTEEVEVIPPSSPQQHDNIHHSQHAGSDFPSEWGGISSEEHDEAIMLEAAMFGGIPEESGYHFPYAPHQLMQNGLDRGVGPYPRHIPRPPSPSLTAQRLIREQQDDEYLAALQADREKALKAKEEAEAALAEERRKEEELHRQQEEEQEIERQLAAKEASLPQEPTPDDENAINLLVRMPDGSRRGRRFHKSDKLQFLFDFIDIGRVVKPGSYRLVRPYPRRAFSDGESTSTLIELGLTSKQEALYLELK